MIDNFGSEYAGIAQMEFPVWVQVICIGVWIVTLALIFRGLYKNYLINIFSKKKVVEAELISKVTESYYETKAYTNAATRDFNSPAMEIYSDSEEGGKVKPATGLRSGKAGIAYRLYFRINGKVVELDVDKKTFNSLPDTGVGMLEYKGNMYHSFVPAA